MYFRWTLFNVCTLALVAVTIWMFVMRVRRVLESTWLLLYYVAVLAYWRSFPGALNPYWVLTGVACGLLLRFEFLGGLTLLFVRVVEFFFFGYIIWRGLQLVLLWPW